MLPHPLATSELCKGGCMNKPDAPFLPAAASEPATAAVRAAPGNELARPPLHAAPVLHASVSPAAIRKQLETILANTTFQASERLRRLLRFVVEESLEGRASQLKAYTLGVSVFERGSSFDPQQDPVVRMETSKLRARLLEYYCLAGSEDPVIISIPKGGYIPVFATASRAALPPAPPIAVAEPVAASANGEPAGPVNQPGEAETDTNAPLLAGGRHHPVVAVLPFIDLGPQQASSYIASGFADEVSVALTRFEDVAVIGSYSTRQFGSSMDLSGIAAQLRARFLLHGSVQVVGGRIRIRAALTDVESDLLLWGESFDKPFTASDLFAIQDGIIQQVVSRIADSFGFIKLALWDEARHSRTDKIEAYDAVLRYHHWVPSFNREYFSQAKQSLEQAMAIDPDYSLLAGMLADIYASDYQLGYNMVPHALDESLKLARRAIAQDARCQTACWVLALNYFLRGDRNRFQQAVLMVVPLNPANSYMLMSTGLLVGMSGDLELGMELMRKAVENNPRSPGWYHIVPLFQFFIRKDYEAALDEALNINTPQCLWDPMLRAAVHGKLGNTNRGHEAVEQLLALVPDFENRWEQLVRALVFFEDPIQDLVAGLRKAGLRCA